MNASPAAESASSLPSDAEIEAEAERERERGRREAERILAMERMTAENRMSVEQRVLAMLQSEQGRSAPFQFRLAHSLHSRLRLRHHQHPRKSPAAGGRLQRISLHRPRTHSHPLNKSFRRQRAAKRRRRRDGRPRRRRSGIRVKTARRSGRPRQRGSTLIPPT
jgi:hypothetical protein